MTEIREQPEMDDPVIVSVLDETPLWSAPFGLRLLERIRLRDVPNVLDIGCGTGFPLTEAAQRLGRRSRVYGIDPWKKVLLRAGEKIAAYGVVNAYVVCAEGEHMPFPDSFFDLVISNNGINNVDDMAALMSECARTCSAGAQMVATMNLDGTMTEFYSLLAEVLEERGMDPSLEKMRSHIYCKRRPVKEVEELLEEAGFSVKEVVEDSFVMRFADGSAMLDHFLIRSAFMGPWIDIVDEPLRDEVFEEVERRMNGRAAGAGEFRLSVPFVTIDCERRG
jgi:arsenite methyltransferase